MTDKDLTVEELLAALNRNWKHNDKNVYLKLEPEAHNQLCKMIEQHFEATELDCTEGGAVARRHGRPMSWLELKHENEVLRKKVLDKPV